MPGNQKPFRVKGAVGGNDSFGKALTVQTYLS